MSQQDSINQQLALAVQYAIVGDWKTAHEITQDYNTPVACWIHAVLHKIEPDEWNSRYWYARSGGHRYEEFADALVEFKAIACQLDSINPMG
jgi:hypothetical protein